MDPVFAHLLSISFSLLFLSAAISKLRERSQFKQILSGYQLLPQAAIGAASLIIPIIELMLAAGLLIPESKTSTAIVASCILVGYGAAIAINLYRGNLSLDCGCQLGETRQSISLALVIRNIALALAVACLTLPVTNRLLGTFDYGALLFGLVITALSYLILNTQIANAITYREINA